MWHAQDAPSSFCLISKFGMLFLNFFLRMWKLERESNLAKGTQPKLVSSHKSPISWFFRSRNDTHLSHLEGRQGQDGNSQVSRQTAPLTFPKGPGQREFHSLPLRLQGGPLME